MRKVLISGGVKDIHHRHRVIVCVLSRLRVVFSLMLCVNPGGLNLLLNKPLSAEKCFFLEVNIFIYLLLFVSIQCPKPASSGLRTPSTKKNLEFRAS